MRSFYLISLLCFSLLLKANEGMWMPYSIDSNLINKISDLGYLPAVDSIYNPGNGGITDAVVVFGPGCTGEVVSGKGLIFTNHHCGYGSIQKLSSVEHDYLRDGYWALSESEELPVVDLTVKFLRGMFDVTDRVLGCLPDSLSESARSSYIDSVIIVINAEMTDSLEYLIQIKPFFNGLSYFASVQEVYKDVRLVAAPPSSLGKFGGDTDNWMWPRHTADFSVWRVYADSCGRPADYSKDNVPLKPKYHLPISLNGLEEGDFTMTLGYPGSTNRYLSSWGINERINVINKTLIDVRGVKQAAWMQQMMKSDAVRIKYSSKYFRSSNYWKNSIGMNKGVQRLGVIQKKELREDSIVKWSIEKNKKHYVEAILALETAYINRATTLKTDYYLKETMIKGAEIFAFSHKIMTLLDENERNSTDVAEINNCIDSFFKDYDLITDKLATQQLIDFYIKNINEFYYPEFIQSSKHGTKTVIDRLFKKSAFADSTRLKSLIFRNKIATLKNDLVCQAANSIYLLRKQLRSTLDLYKPIISRGERQLLQALKEMSPSEANYPDANFTLRMSVGTVGAYQPADAIYYNHYTTIDGVIEKYQPNDLEFDLPIEFVDLAAQKQFGDYADSLGQLRVCFISNNDITGGNSGSPVLNSKGELCGLAFDGNWEAMSGDIAFEDKLQRTITVDIRYVLFLIDKYGKAGYLLDELKLEE